MCSCSRFFLLALFLSVQSALSAPLTLSQAVVRDGETFTMQLKRLDLRGDHFELLVQNAAGAYDTAVAVEERSYLGSVDGLPGAVSCGVLQDDGTFRGAIYFDRGATWFTLGGEVVRTRATDYDSFSDYEFPTASTVTAGQAGTRMYSFDLAVDADFDFYENAGSDVALALERIEYSATLVRAIYLRDAILRLDLGRVIIRVTEAQNPYNGFSAGGYLSELRNHWRELQTDSGHDVVAGVSRRKIGGGLAWVGTIASSSGASVSQSRSDGSFDGVFRHELGHNWGCGHFVGGRPEGAGLMGGNQPGRLTGCELYRVLREREEKIASLDDEGVFSGVELPPYASLDAPHFRDAVASELEIDVLANDHDANGQVVSLLSFDAVSAGGGTVTLEGGNLIYRAGFVAGTDWFTYRISDPERRTATGAVVIGGVTNRVRTGSATLITRSFAEVDGALIGHDIDPASVVTLVWGSEDGGASIAGWENSRVVVPGVDGEISALLERFPARGSVVWNIVANFPEGKTFGEARSFALPRKAEGVKLVPSGALGAVTVPTDASDGTAWQVEGFDDGSWTVGRTGVGYESSGSNYVEEGLLLTDIGEAMEGNNESVYLRVPFAIPDSDLLGSLKTMTLQMNYDDGFVAFLNGTEIARANAPGSPQWNSAATDGHPDGEAEEAVAFDVTAFLGELVLGENILAIHGLNDGLNSSDMLVLPELVATAAIASTLVSRGAPLRYLSPTGATDEGTWFGLGFDDTAWMSGMSGIGYDYDDFVAIDVEDVMTGDDGNPTLWVRFPFDLPLPATPGQTLEFSIYYDDAFVAYLNGVEIARGGGVPAALTFESSATRSGEEAEDGAPFILDISDRADLLVVGRNVLAVHGLNAGLSSSDFLLDPELVLFAGPPTELKDYADWLAGYPGLAAQAPGDDPDSDGISNLFEYISGGDPGTGSQSAAGQPLLPTVTSDGSNLGFTIRRRADFEARGIEMAVQWSADLVSWSTDGLLISDAVMSLDNLTEFLTYTPVGGMAVHSRIYFRLDVISAP